MENLELALTLGALLVAATAWLTTRIARIPWETRQQIEKHEGDCENYLAGSGTRKAKGCAE